MDALGKKINGENLMAKRNSDSTKRVIYSTRSPTSNGSSPAIFYDNRVWVPPTRRSRFASDDEVKVLKSATKKGDVLTIRGMSDPENLTEEWVPAKSLISTN
jgi:hypothetical protein